MKSFFKIGIAYDVKEDYKLDSEDWKYSDFSTLAEVQYVKRLFEKRGHSVVLLGNYEEIYNLLKNNTFPAVDVVFNMAEGIGSRNRESWIPSLLEINGIPFTGSDAFALSLSLSKFHTKLVAKYLNILTPPTADEQQEYSEQKETLEERHYSGDEVEARGLFDYDDSEIDKYPYRLIRAIRYTEMICRALPAFHSRLKVSQKSEIIDFIYSYPRKIIYALLRPIDTHIDELCDMLLAYAAETGKKKSDGSDYTHDDFQNMFFDYARAASLSLYNHFAEICTSPKTTQKLVERDSTDAIEKIARLLIIENSGNTDELLKEAEAVIKHSKDMNTRIMAQIVVRKHLLYNKKLSFSKKQQLVDRIFGKSARKTLLSPSRTL